MLETSLERFIERHGIDLGDTKVILLDDAAITLDRLEGIHISPVGGRRFKAHSMDELYWLNRLEAAQRPSVRVDLVAAD